LRSKEKIKGHCQPKGNNRFSRIYLPKWIALRQAKNKTILDSSAHSNIQRPIHFANENASFFAIFVRVLSVGACLSLAQNWNVVETGEVTPYTSEWWCINIIEIKRSRSRSLGTKM